MFDSITRRFAVNSTPYPRCSNHCSMVDTVSPGLTAYVIVDTTKVVGGDGFSGWVVEVDALVPPVRERVTGATVVRGTGFRDSARRASALARPPLVAATLLVEESVLTTAVPALRAMMPTANTAAAAFGLIDFFPSRPRAWVGTSIKL